MSVTAAADPTHAATPTGAGGLTVGRLNVMRFGYAFMAVGLVVVKWPQLPEAHDQPVWHSVVTSLLVAVSLLAFLGLRHPTGMLPILLFEVIWKLIWISAVAVPRIAADTMTTTASDILVNCSFVVVVMAVIPWRYAWRRYARMPGEAWRGR